ncbi:MAG: glycosyltransferase family 39 protein [Verrucomicrobia bacterium]|nr:glycosyltransferase family 39 protein [Verrucomicrobiota bacterium]
MNSVASSPSSSGGAWLRRHMEAHPFVALGLLALAVRLATMPFVPAPGYLDAYYHYGVASRLYHGHGFTETIVWSYLTPPAGLEHPVDACWMSLQAVCIWLSFLLFGENLRAAQIPAVLFSSALAALSAWVAWDLTRSRRYLWWTGWFAIFSGFWFPHWVGTDYFALYGLTGAASLVLTYRAVRDDARWFVPAGVCGGLAYLTRGHGQLFVMAMALCWVCAVWRGRIRAGRSGLWLAAGLLAALLTVSPWLLHLQRTQGVQSAEGFSKMMFLREFNDVFLFDAQRLHWRYYLNLTDPSPSWGLWPLAKSKLAALGTNLDLWVRPALFFMTPLLLLGLFGRRDGPLAQPLGRRVEFGPFWIYSAALYLLISLVFTFPGTHGTTFHVAGALLPFILPPTLVGLDDALDWLGRRWRPEAREERRRFYAALAFAIAAALGVIWTAGTARSWRDYHRAHLAIASAVAPQVPAGAAVMIVDPAAYYHVTGQPAVVIAGEGPAAAAAAARRYHVAFLVLEARAVPSEFVGFYETNAARSADWTFAGQPLPDVKLFKLSMR